MATYKQIQMPYYKWIATCCVIRKLEKDNKALKNEINFLKKNGVCCE